MNNVAQKIYSIIIEKIESDETNETITYQFPRLNMFGLDVHVVLNISIANIVDRNIESSSLGESRLDIRKKVLFYYKIYADVLYYITERYSCLTNEFMTKFCESIDEFKLIKYSKTQGFYQEKKHFVDPVEFLFLETDEIKLNIQDCVVCYDKTKDKLDCSHYLCAHCHQKLKKQKCPICRKNINCDGDDDDDDDDE